jgi:hypothetical protein
VVAADNQGMSATKTRVVCVAGLLWCGAVLLLHAVAADLSCWEYKPCADPVRRTIYRGVLSDEHGHPLPSTPFTVAFASRADQPRLGRFRTDGHGGYCVVWAYESSVPMLYDEAIISRTPVRMETLDKPDATPPAGCATPRVKIPWKRSFAITGTWQYRSLTFVMIIPALLLLVGLARGRGWRSGITLTGAATTFWLVLWLT